MISRRGVLSGVVANPSDEDISTVQSRILSVEAQAAALAHSMQKIHGGRWGYAYDEDAAAVFIFQRFD